MAKAPVCILFKPSDMKPGTRVKCVDSSFSPEVLKLLRMIPEKGKVYTVRDLIPDPMGKLSMGITLEGIINPKHWVPCKRGAVKTEFSFRWDRFEPLDEIDAILWDDMQLLHKKPLPQQKN